MQFNLTSTICHKLIEINNQYISQLSDLNKKYPFPYSSEEWSSFDLNVAQWNLECNFLFEQWNRECACCVFLQSRECHDWFMSRVDDEISKRTSILEEIKKITQKIK